MKVRGVLDRIEDGEIAVILLEEIGMQFMISKSKLSEQSRTGTWFTVEVQEGEIKSIAIDEETTMVKQAQLETKLERLRQRGNDI